MAPASREEPVVAGPTEVSLPLRRSTPTSDSCTGAGHGGDRSPGRAAPGPPQNPSPVQETLPARRSRPQVAASPGRREWSRRRLQLLVQSRARSEERRPPSGVPGPKSAIPAGTRGRGAGAEERPGRRALRSIVAARAQPRALGPAAKRVSGPVSRAGLRDARSQRYK